MPWLANGIDQRLYGLQRISMLQAPVSVRQAEVALAGRHGVVLAGSPTFAPPTLVAEYLLRGPEVDADEKALRALLSTRGLTLTRPDGTTAAARLVSLVTGDRADGLYARVTAHIRVPGVFFRGPLMDSTVILGNVAHLVGSTAPIADAVVRVDLSLWDYDTGPDVSVTDDTSGTGFTMIRGAGGMPHSWLFVNCATHRAWWAGSSTNWTGTGTSVTEISGWIEPHAAGMLELTPVMDGTDPRMRKFSVSSSGGGSVRVQARAAYL